MSINKVTTLSAGSIEGFRSWLIERGSSPRTVEAYCQDLKVLLQDLGEGFIEEKDFNHVSIYWLNLSTKRKSPLYRAPKTTIRRLTSLRVFSQWAGWEVDSLSSFRAPSAVSISAQPLANGFSDIAQLINQEQKEQSRILVGLCGYAGLSLSEALAVKPDNISVKDMTLEIPGAAPRGRTLPVSDRLMLVLERGYVRNYPEQSALVAYGDREARNNIARCAKIAGLERVTSQALRATFGDHVLRYSSQPELASMMLGHASPKELNQETLLEMRRIVNT